MELLFSPVVFIEMCINSLFPVYVCLMENVINGGLCTLADKTVQELAAKYLTC